MTDRQTDRSMKTEGPILVTSPGLAYVSLDIEWSNSTVLKVRINKFSK